jgi:hypothetical protein
VLVLGPGGFVAVELDELGELVGLLVVGDVAVLVVDEGVDFVVLLLLELEQSWAARLLTLPAPCLRFLTSVLLTLAGSAETSRLKAREAVSAAAQLWAETADETELSWPLRMLA